MRKISKYFSYFLIAIGLMATTMAQAAHVPISAPIATLFSTGLSPIGFLLAAGLEDPNYVLTMAPPGVPAPAAPIVVGPLDEVWVANTDSSQWINPTGTAAFVEGGEYWYETTFDLSGFDASTAYIEGGWAVDDASLGMFLNGALLPGITTGPGVGSYAGLHPFIIEGAGLSWLPGINTLTFKTFNTSGFVFTGPTGLHVKIVDAHAAVVPIPGAVWLFLSGLISIITVARRR